jgi:hypothetical protein
MSAFETIQARQAALMLHALPADVRQRVMSKLDAAEAARLLPLLDELGDLGVSQSLGDRLQRVILPADTGTSTQASSTTVADLAVYGQVARLEADVVAKCLESCAPVTVAQLLRARDWPWKTQVLELMAESRRAAVHEWLRNRSVELAPAAVKALCERLSSYAARLSSQAERASVARRSQIPGGLRRWLAWIR